MAFPGANFAKWMKLGGTRHPEERIPDIRTESGDAREAGLYVAKLHRANQSGEICEKGSQIGVSVVVRGFVWAMHSTRKMAARVSRPTTVCGRTTSLSALGGSMSSVSIRDGFCLS